MTRREAESCRLRYDATGRVGMPFLGVGAETAQERCPKILENSTGRENRPSKMENRAVPPTGNGV